MFVILMFIFELFIETTSMVSQKYKPVLTLANVFIQSDRLPKIKFLERYRANRSEKRKVIDHVVMLCCLLIVIGEQVLIFFIVVKELLKITLRRFLLRRRIYMRKEIEL